MMHHSENETFSALVSSGTGVDGFHIEQHYFSVLPENDVLIKVLYSSLNYKDALSAKGHPGITRNYPHIPGIDAVGVVVSDKSQRFEPNQRVVVTGYDLGMNTFGGFGQYCCVPADWVHVIPDGISFSDAACLGTAGITAGLAVEKCNALNQLGLLQKNTKPHVLITGASGGVGSLSVALLAHLGYEVTAVSGKSDQYAWLRQLGATEILSRTELEQSAREPKPLLQSRYHFCIETTGGYMLEAALKHMQKEGVIAVCGNAAGHTFSTTVYPFILRGNSLLGIDSAHIGFDIRQKMWTSFANKWKLTNLDLLKREIGLMELPAAIKAMLNGKSFGRVVVRLVD